MKPTKIHPNTKILVEGYFFTPEQLNKYTQSVIKQALETAAEKAKWDSSYHEISFGHSDGYDFISTDYAGDPCTGYNVFVNKQSITNTFEETFKKFKV